MGDIKVLMVGEKPLIASTIASILSNNNCTTRPGKSPSCKVHEFVADFQGHRAFFKVTSVIGHIFSLDFPNEFQNRETVDPGTLFEAPTIKKESKPEARITQHLKKEAKGCDYLVLWLDCDREGENICFEVINCTKAYLKPKNHQQIFRAHFSSLVPVDIRAAIKNLIQPNENESQAVDARCEIDLKVGVAFSRFQTKFFQGKFGDLDSHLISYGPCQTPTLGFCVDRHDEIQTFTPEPFWSLSVSVKIDNYQIPLQWKRKRIFDNSVCSLYQEILKQFSYCKLEQVTSKPAAHQRPKPLNTVELLKIASKQLGLGPHTTMQVAEKLYTQGFISYPRTETTKYASNFNPNGILKEHSTHPVWGPFSSQLLAASIQLPTGGHDAGDHPPITPMRVASEMEIGGGNNWRIYEYICRHFLASLAPNCKYKKTKIKFSVGEEEFSCSGSEIIEEGFVTIMPWCKVSDIILPDLSVTPLKTQFPITHLPLISGVTAPPGYLSESELISQMEKNGIGTDASISTHINNICERGYVAVQGINRTLVPTKVGIALVHGYHRIDPDLVLPVIRSSIENYCNLIAQGLATIQQVVAHSLLVFQQKYNYFVTNIEKMQALFEADFSPIEETVGKFSSKCGKCQRYMKFLNFKPSRLFCPHCDQVYPLPQGANIKLFQELKCPLDEFELVLVSFGKSKTYSVCPYCYNYPPFENVPSGMGCNQCLHPTCKHSLIKNSLTKCPDCEKGTLVFATTSKPNWRFNCNSCQFVVFAAKGAHNVILLDEKCEDCTSTLLKVDFNKNDTPLPGGETVYEGCLLCDELLNGLMHSELSKKVHPMFQRGRGGRRRGGGRGGRKRGGRR